MKPVTDSQNKDADSSQTAEPKATPTQTVGDSLPDQSAEVKKPTRRRGKGGKRLGRAELVLRIRIVEGLMLKGFLGRDIQRALESQCKTKIPWNTIKTYMRHIAAMWEEEDAIMRPHRRARQLRQLHDAADIVRQREDWKIWIEMQRLIARIEGNEAPQEHTISVRERFYDWTTEELEQYATTGQSPIRFRRQSSIAATSASEIPLLAEYTEVRTGESEGRG